MHRQITINNFIYLFIIYFVHQKFIAFNFLINNKIEKIETKMKKDVKH